VNCRSCGHVADLPLIDLGTSPPSNAYLTESGLDVPEVWYPLRVLVCESCWLVQTEDFTRADEVFHSEYAYFSGYSSTWVDHCRSFATQIGDRLALDSGSTIIEVASNDGTMLRELEKLGTACLGIEPTASTAAVAREAGLTVVEEFLTAELGRRLHAEGLKADLLVANNVLAHVPEIVDFATGCGSLLSQDGVATFEFPHLVDLIASAQFDTIYHEHFSYLSLLATEAVLKSAGMHVFDAERIPTHGGSLRVFAQRTDAGSRLEAPGLHEIRRLEESLGVASSDFYSGFQNRADRISHDLSRFLLDAECNGEMVVAYGAAAKGNTLLNFAGVRQDLVQWVADRNPAKVGMFLPGSRIPIVDESEVRRHKPDYVLVLPRNLTDEVSEQLDYIREWSGLFVTAVPELAIW
jgi:2-polyprenyl-3-methyl-5-hydroxy-6-metoxy-1,4-benzoquinol methylase